MDLIEKFLPFVNPQRVRLHPYVEHHYGLAMARKYSSLVDELSKARMSTLGAVSVKADGGGQIVNQPGMGATQARISDLEPRISRLLEISTAIGTILESEGCNPTIEGDDIREKLRLLELETGIEPALWQRFTLLHDRNKLRLPSEIVVDSEYSEYERELLAKRDAAAAQIAPLKEKMAEIGKLAEEALSL